MLNPYSVMPVAVVLYLLRHGEAPQNVPGHPPTANGLTELGELQAAAVGDRISERTGGAPLAAAFSSSLQRATTTRELLLPRVGLVDGGVTANLPVLTEVSPAETDAQRAQRAAAALNLLRELAVALVQDNQDNAGPHYLCAISHGNFMQSLFAKIQEEAADVGHNHELQPANVPENCALTYVRHCSCCCCCCCCCYCCLSSSPLISFIFFHEKCQRHCFTARIAAYLKSMACCKCRVRCAFFQGLLLPLRFLCICQ